MGAIPMRPRPGGSVASIAFGPPPPTRRLGRARGSAVSSISRSHRQGSAGVGVVDQPELRQGPSDAGTSSITRSTTQQARCPREESNLRTRFRKPLAFGLAHSPATAQAPVDGGSRRHRVKAQTAELVLDPPGSSLSRCSCDAGVPRRGSAFILRAHLWTVSLPAGDGGSMRPQ